jgi:hypothetical protein
MFRFARFIVQHKISVVALGALGVVLFMPEKEDETKSNSPWALQAAPVEAEEPGVIDGLIAEADTMLAESGYDPREQAEEAVGRFDDTANKFSEANSH